MLIIFINQLTAVILKVKTKKESRELAPFELTRINFSAISFFVGILLCSSYLQQQVWTSPLNGSWFAFLTYYKQREKLASSVLLINYGLHSFIVLCIIDSLNNLLNRLYVQPWEHKVKTPAQDPKILQSRGR